MKNLANCQHQNKVTYKLSIKRQILTDSKTGTVQEKLYKFHSFMVTLHQEMNNQVEQATTHPFRHTVNSIVVV